jgi:hypothetical protein
VRREPEAILSLNIHPYGSIGLHHQKRATTALRGIRTIDRKLFAMKGFHHPGGSQRAFLMGLAQLYNLIPYQRRALNAGKCGVEIEGGRVPTSDWVLNLQILTSGGYRPAGMGATT